MKICKKRVRTATLHVGSKAVISAVSLCGLLAQTTCARRRLFRTAEEEKLEFNAVPCSARRLRAVGLVLAAMLETVWCRRVRNACCSFVRDILQPTSSASLGSLFERLLHGRCATSPQTGRWVIRYAVERRTLVASETRAVASSGTVYSRRRARAGSSMFVQRSATSVGHGARSCSDVGMSVVVASRTRAIGSSRTAYGRRHLRANRLSSAMATNVSPSWCRDTGRRLVRHSLLSTMSAGQKVRSSHGVKTFHRHRVTAPSGCGLVRDSLQSRMSADRTARLLYCVVTSLSSRRGRERLWTHPGQSIRSCHYVLPLSRRGREL